MKIAGTMKPRIERFMPPRKLPRSVVMPLIGIGFGIGIIFTLTVRDNGDDLSRGSYERGAHAVAMHHKCVGDYGSMSWRKKAFLWGDPQDCDDVERIERIYLIKGNAIETTD